MIEAEKAQASWTPSTSSLISTTPNHSLICPSRRLPLKLGIPVMSDKPATATYAEKQALEAIVAKSGLPYGPRTHTYAGHAMVRAVLPPSLRQWQSRAKFARWPSNYFSRLDEASPSKTQATSRPHGVRTRRRTAKAAQLGISGHSRLSPAFLNTYFCLQVKEINATLRSVVEGRRSR